jgi:hypothetical protein
VSLTLYLLSLILSSHLALTHVGKRHTRRTITVLSSPLIYSTLTRQESAARREPKWRVRRSYASQHLCSSPLKVLPLHPTPPSPPTIYSAQTPLFPLYRFCLSTWICNSALWPPGTFYLRREALLVSLYLSRHTHKYKADRALSSYSPSTLPQYGLLAAYSTALPLSSSPAPPILLASQSQPLSRYRY